MYMPSYFTMTPSGPVFQIRLPSRLARKASFAVISFPLQAGSKRAARQQALKYAARAHHIFEALEENEGSFWCKRSIIGLLQSDGEQVLLMEDNAASDNAADVPGIEIHTGLLLNSGVVCGGPKFTDAIAAYRADLAMRQGEAGNSNIANLESRARMFVSLFGDLPIGQINNGALRSFGYAISYLPAEIARKGSWSESNLIEILKSNGFPGFGRDDEVASDTPVVRKTPISEKTLLHKTLNVIKTALFFHAGNEGIALGVRDFRLNLPEHTPRSKPRKKPDLEAVNAILENGLADGRLVQAMLPLLGRLTGRRLGLLAYMRCEYLQKQGRHYLMQVPASYTIDGKKVSVPVKSDESTLPFVLHDALKEIGLIDYMKQRKSGWLFESLHLPSIQDPAATAQKRCSKLTRDVDAVFHQLRHFAKGEMRNAGLSSEVIRLQVGHAAQDAHENYSRQFEANDIKALATRKLDGADLRELFRNFDFEHAELHCMGKAKRKARQTR